MWYNFLMAEITVRFGGSLPKKVLTYGFIILRGGRIIDRGYGRGGQNLKSTLTVAKWLGCLRGLVKALEYVEEGTKTITIQSNNSSILKQASGNWKCRSEHVIPIRDAIQDLAKYLKKEMDIEVVFEFVAI